MRLDTSQNLLQAFIINQIEGVEAELFDREREDREVLPVEAPGQRQMLHERRVDWPVLDRPRHRPRDVEQREEIDAGIGGADRVERLFPSAHAREPVVHERDLHVGRTVAFAPLLSQAGLLPRLVMRIGCPCPPQRSGRRRGSGPPIAPTRTPAPG